NTDRADDGGGVGEDVVAAGGEVVSAAGGHPADADDQRLALGSAAGRLPHHLTGQGAAAGRVDAQDDRLDVVILDRQAEGLAQVVAADGVAVAEERIAGFAINDHAIGVDQGDRRLVAGLGLPAEELEQRQRAGKVDRLALGDAVVLDDV